jgi:DNA mismatch endonuclease (patch repair protein)
MLNSCTNTVTKKRARNPTLVSSIMARVKSQHTGPEIQLRNALRSFRYKFETHVHDLPGKPDIVFSIRKVAVFVDGDFWHGRQWRLRGLSSLESQFHGTPNRSYWIRKIAGNIRRDARINRQLRGMGWRVTRIWESELKANTKGCIRRIERMLSRHLIWASRTL